MDESIIDIISNIKQPNLESLDLSHNFRNGLPNLGNTCYLNSILQILMHTPELIHFFLSNDHCIKLLMLNNKYKDILIATKFTELFVSYWTQDEATLRKDLFFFKKTLGKHFAEFAGSKQNDQHECIIYLLDILHQAFCMQKYVCFTGYNETAINKLEKDALSAYCSDLSGYVYPRPANTIYISPISELFVGQYHKRSECVNCHHISHRFETFKTLDVTIPKKKENITLYDCLNHLTKITQLDKENMLECDNCKIKNRSRRRGMIWKLPKILIVYITRNLTMVKDGEFYQTKNPRQVDIPHVLDLSKYISNRFIKTNYKLNAIACHHGMPSFGHCTSYINFSDQWNMFDDNKVSSITVDYIQGPEAYLAFYRVIE